MTSAGGDGEGAEDVAVDADGRAEGVASDDEAASDGRDDTRTFDANNQRHESSSESESEGDGSDGDGDQAAKQKRDKELLAKLKSKERRKKRGTVYNKLPHAM